MRISEAYYYNEQKEWVKWRRLYSIVVNLGTGEGEVVTEEQIMWLPYLDKPDEATEIKTAKRLNAEEIRQAKIRDGIIQA